MQNLCVCAHFLQYFSHYTHAVMVCDVMLCCLENRQWTHMINFPYSWCFSFHEGNTSCMFVTYFSGCHWRLKRWILHIHMQMGVPLFLFSSLLFSSYISSVHALLLIFYVRSIFSSLHIYIYIYIYIHIYIYSYGWWRYTKIWILASDESAEQWNVHSSILRSF